MALDEIDITFTMDTKGSMLSNAYHSKPKTASSSKCP